MKQFIKLNNETFEVKKAKGELHPIEVIRGLHDCYAKPSFLKISIYNKWIDWLAVLDAISKEYHFKNLTLYSYNANMFTLLGDVHKNGELIGQLYITKTRQEFWLA